MTIPTVSATIVTTVTLMFRKVFSFLARSIYLSVFFGGGRFSFIFTTWSAGPAQFTRWKAISFKFINTRSVVIIRLLLKYYYNNWWQVIFFEFINSESVVIIFHSYVIITILLEYLITSDFLRIYRLKICYSDRDGWYVRNYKFGRILCLRF